MGIPEGEEEKIFEKFYRVKSVPHRTIRGTGLGLALVRETVEAHGGRVWVESRPGSGSTFYLRLPAVAAGREGES
jgi:two-component system sensor histidine kinase SenX3